MKQILPSSLRPVHVIESDSRGPSDASFRQHILIIKI